MATKKIVAPPGYPTLKDFGFEVRPETSDGDDIKPIIESGEIYSSIANSVKITQRAEVPHDQSQ